MVFQVRKWGWKQLATNLLLIPVLTGGAAAVAQAQFSSGSASAPTSMTAQPAQTNTPTDPKILLEQGRKAMAAGDFERAKDLSRAAEANNVSGRWGLFDDTPNALRRDIESAIAKAKKTQAASLTK